MRIKDVAKNIAGEIFEKSMELAIALDNKRYTAIPELKAALRALMSTYDMCGCKYSFRHDYPEKYMCIQRMLSNYVVMYKTGNCKKLHEQHVDIVAASSEGTAIEIVLQELCADDDAYIKYEFLENPGYPDERYYYGDTYSYEDADCIAVAVMYDTYIY